MSIRRNRNSGGSGCVGAVIFIIVALTVTFQMQQRSTSPSSPTLLPMNAAPAARSRNPIHRQLASPPGVERKDGVAAFVLIDTSGSMSETVTGPDGRSMSKIDIARRRLLDVIRQTRQAVDAHPDRVIHLGVIEFSSRDGRGASRVVIPLGIPNPAAAESVINSLKPSGGTPIGDAIVHAKGLLNNAGLSRMHILVITDGANTQGYDPADVMQAMSQIPDPDRAAVYFIAFDIAAEVFAPVRDAGGLVLPAANDADLKQTLDFVLTGKILAEQMP